MKKRLLELSETKTLVKAILLLTIIFGFNDGSKKFIFENWFTNLILVCLIVGLIVLVYVYGLKLAARHYGTELTIKIWNSHKFKGPRSLSRKISLIYTTPILNLLITLFSNGKFYFASLLTFNVKKEVIGRKYPYLSYFDISNIVFIGLLFCLGLMWIFKTADIFLGLKISFWFILFNLIPISELPGAKIFAGSMTFYIFCLVFFLVNILMLFLMNSILAVIISVVFSTLVATIYYYFYQYSKSG